MPKCRVAEPDSRIPPEPTRVEVGLGGTTGTGQINDHARSKNSSLALCPPFTQNNITIFHKYLGFSCMQMKNNVK